MLYLFIYLRMDDIYLGKAQFMVLNDLLKDFGARARMKYALWFFGVLKVHG